jgi:hypothetical protein
MALLLSGSTLGLLAGTRCQRFAEKSAPRELARREALFQF